VDDSDEEGDDGVGESIGEEAGEDEDVLMGNSLFVS